jgi:putative copper export protein
MLSVGWDTIRVFLHVLAATVWVGGQITLGALVPALRGFGAPVTRAAARQFNRVAWSAFGVLVLTGGWNMAAEHDKMHGSYQTTVWVKLAVVLLSGVAAFLHTRATTPRANGILGGLSALAALAALFVGVMLAG